MIYTTIRLNAYPPLGSSSEKSEINKKVYQRSHVNINLVFVYKSMHCIM